ncbi:MAG: HNH endonuclease [Planctomycetota bacterium]|jgi:hypothetical protein
MPLLYYWRPDNYRRDLDNGAGYHLNQLNPLMHSIDIGDTLWAFTRNKRGGYAIVAKLLVKAKTINPLKFRFGRYRVWGDLTSSKYFQIESQTNAEDIIRSLSCKTDAKILGRAFQGKAAVRPISLQDHKCLLKAAKKLSLEPRARLLPEDKLEAELFLGDSKTIKKFLRDEPAGITKKRREYLYQQAPARNKNLVDKLQASYKGKCQICRWAPRDNYGRLLCQGHHLQWLSRGGRDVLKNMVLICPNHHVAVHRCDSPFDFADHAFHFPTHKESLLLNTHLK